LTTALYHFFALDVLGGTFCIASLSFAKNPFSYMQLKSLLMVLLAILVMALVVAGYYGYKIFFLPVTGDQEVEFKIRRGWALSQIADSLAARGIVESPENFLAAAKLSRRAAQVKAGKYIIAPRASNLDLIRLFVSGKAARQRLIIPEGFTAEAIAGLLQRELEIDSTAVMNLIKDREFIDEVDIEAPSLEGYLYPNTYQFYWGDTPRDVISLLVTEFHKRVPDSLLARADSLNMSMHEIVTLASIIEGEARVDSERAIISAVYWNRLRKGMRLQADPTIQYIIPGPPRRVLNRDLEIDSPYNTYKYAGLPPGPVNNPGIKSILAALYPKSVGYLYFVARGDGSHIFSYSLEQHNAAKRAFDRYRAQVKASASRSSPVQASGQKK